MMPQPSITSNMRPQLLAPPPVHHHPARSPTLNDFMSLRIDAGAGANQFTQVPRRATCAARTFSKHPRCVGQQATLLKLRSSQERQGSPHHAFHLWACTRTIITRCSCEWASICDSLCFVFKVCSARLRMNEQCRR